MNAHICRQPQPHTYFTYLSCWPPRSTCICFHFGWKDTKVTELGASLLRDVVHSSGDRMASKAVPARVPSPILLTALPTHSATLQANPSPPPTAVVLSTSPNPNFSPKPRQHPTKHPLSLRLPACFLPKRNLARLTFQATVAFGALTLLYQAISLVPLFQSTSVAAHALGIQGDSARDGRQSLTHGFLQECRERKVCGIFHQPTARSTRSLH